MNADPLSFGGDVRWTPHQPRDWNRKVTPAHFVVFITGCALVGFLSGVGLAALATSAIWQRVRDALGW